MTSILKTKVLEYVTNQRRSIRDLERQAGLNYNAIHNILSDRSKSPSIDTVLKIADAIDCSVDEILGRTQFKSKSDTLDKQDVILNNKLFQNICKYIGEFIDDNNLEKLTLSDVVYCVEEIYRYCLNTQSKALDKKFAKWFLEQKLIKIL